MAENLTTPIPADYECDTDDEGDVLSCLERYMSDSWADPDGPIEQDSVDLDVFLGDCENFYDAMSEDDKDVAPETGSTSSTPYVDCGQVTSDRCTICARPLFYT